MAEVDPAQQARKRYIVGSWCYTDSRNRLGDWHGQQQEEDGWTVVLNRCYSRCLMLEVGGELTDKKRLSPLKHRHPILPAHSRGFLSSVKHLRTDSNSPGLLLSQISVPRLFPDTVTSLCSKHKLFCFLANRGGMRDWRTRALAGA